MMSSFHLATTKLPGNFPIFSIFLALLRGIAFNLKLDFRLWPNPFALVYTYWIPNSQFNNSCNSMFIGKCLDYAGNWPMISIGVGFQKNNFSLLKFLRFLLHNFGSCSVWLNSLCHLPKMCLMYVVFFSNVCDNMYLLIQSFQVEA